MSRKATWQMSATELARVWADHFGYEGRPGGWIYDPRGRPVAHGWDEFTARLQRRGFIVRGQGINWRASGETPRFR
jgi:hypothetical protein